MARHRPTGRLAAVGFGVSCQRPRTVTLIDGRTVCAYCPDWRDECQARAILEIPKERRRAFLFGEHEPDRFGVMRLKTKGLQQIHGEETAQRVADLVRRVWEHGRAGGQAAG